MESDLEDMRRKLDMAEGSKSAMQQQVVITIKRHLSFAADDNFKFCCFFKNNK